jgi:hypothetical protein
MPVSRNEGDHLSVLNEEQPAVPPQEGEQSIAQEAGSTINTDGQQVSCLIFFDLN